MFNKIEKNDFDKAPIFFKCPVCKEIGFIYLGNAIGHSGLVKGRRLFKCNHCDIVISES